MAMSVKSTQATTKGETAKHQAKMICELTRKNWDVRQNKAVQLGKLYRGRPAQKPEHPRDKQGVFRLQGICCQIAKRITPRPESSAVRLAKQPQGGKQTTVLRHVSGNNEYFVSKADEILAEVHKVLVFRHEDPFINAVCNKRCSKPAKESDGRFCREFCRADVKNAYFRKSLKTAGERALDEGKAANSSRQGYAKGAGNKNEMTSETDNDIPEGAEREETKSVE